MDTQTFDQILQNVQKPGRYIDIELYAIKHTDLKELNVVLSFPDLYDIGMSNNAIRILYSYLNTKLESTACERVFTPYPDMEKLLEQHQLPLFTLETQKPVKDFDILAFSIGYELLATNILTILKSSKIPLLSTERNKKDPVVIAGGPVTTNPMPFSSFIDCFFIGDFESGGLELFSRIEKIKIDGGNRSDILSYLQSRDDIWFYGKKEQIKRSIWTEFSYDSSNLQFPLPLIDVVQDQGVVEIMRGCPNGCRFCHAGSYYKPVREKAITNVLSQVDFLVSHYGYKEITLSSLSSGDYVYIKDLITILSDAYKSQHISFNLPSLKVTSFTLDILEQLSTVRKSGLTFAIETPDIINQRALNKEVFIEQIINILKEAKSRGWKLAKFYFMIGLPVPNKQDEATAIVNFLEQIAASVRLQYNVNIGTFVPKSHTPYQWSPQLSEENSLNTIYEIKRQLPKNRFKVGFHSPFASVFEGIIARGDERVGRIILDGFKKGARLDAWEEHFNRDLWKEVLENNSFAYDILKGYSKDSTLPWEIIDIGVTKNFLLQELKKSDNSVLTNMCKPNCTHNCGVCDDEITVSRNNEETLNLIAKNEMKKNTTQQINQHEDYKKMIFQFSKLKNARYLSNINLYNMFQRVFQIAGIPVKYTQGFNPKAKLEIVQPLSLGIGSVCETAKIEILKHISEEDFIAQINVHFPEGISVKKAYSFEQKTKSLSALYSGSVYSIKQFENSNMNLSSVIENLYELYSGFQYRLIDDYSAEISLPITAKVKNILKLFSSIMPENDHPLTHFSITRTNIFTTTNVNNEEENRGVELFDFIVENVF